MMKGYMDSESLFNYAIIMVVMPAIVALMQSSITNIISYFTRKYNIYFNSGVDIKVTYTKDICGDMWIPDKMNNHKLINLISKYIIDSGTKYEYAECDLVSNFNGYNNGIDYDFDNHDESDINKDTSDRKFTLVLRPFEKITIEDITFELYEDSPDIVSDDKKQNSKRYNKTTERSITCNIKSTLGNKRVNEFLEKLLKTNEYTLMGISQKPHVYIQMASPNKLYFNKFSPTNHITFDNIFFDEKETLIELLDDFLADKPTMRRLNLLLHGVPGCGKSSIIKAIANYTNFNVIIVKLSYINSDMDIFNVLFDPCISACGGMNYVPINKRIYVFEDIDAESNIVHTRDKSLSEPVPNDQNNDSDSDIDKFMNTPAPTTYESESTTNLLIKAIASTKDPNNSSKITLSGLLNALDGVLEFNSIMIMTTNYPEKLDPALTRYGRFTMKIGLSHMTPENAHKLIKYYYKDYDNSLEIPNKITPATLASYICCSRTLEKLKCVLNAHNCNII